MTALPQFLAEDEIGQIIFDMADRVLAMDKVVSGTVAKYTFEMDGDQFEIVMRVKK